jgi:hypothetical protein
MVDYMNKLFFLLALTLSSASYANLNFCVQRHADEVITKARNHSTYDKNLHCSVSCMLTLRCGRGQTLIVGYLKEFRDLLGYGTPDKEDIKANRYGIDLVTSQRASIDLECFEQCDLRY